MASTVGASGDSRDDVDPALSPFMYWIARCNNGLANLDTYAPFRFQGTTVGYVDRTFAVDHLERFPDVFVCDGGEVRLQQCLEDMKDLEERSCAVQQALLRLRDEELVKEVGSRTASFTPQTPEQIVQLQMLRRESTGKL